MRMSGIKSTRPSLCHFRICFKDMDGAVQEITNANLYPGIYINYIYTPGFFLLLSINHSA